MVKKYLFFTCLVCFHAFSQVSGVGINTENPQQALHLGSPTGTVRVEGLNNPNNLYNGGGVNNTFPLYVDNNGDFSLENKVLQNSGSTIAWTPLSLTSSSITVPNTGTGSVTVLLYSQSITVTKPSVLEVKYSLSFDVKRDAISNLKSTRSRAITNYFTIDAGTRKFGQSGKCFYSYDTASINAQGTMYNGANTLISLPTAGTYVLKLWGNVSTGPNKEATLVDFATGYSSFFLKLY